MGINEKFPPQLLPLSVNPASGRARASLLRSMCHHVDEQHVTCLKSAHPSGPANAHLHASQ